MSEKDRKKQTSPSTTRELVEINWSDNVGDGTYKWIEEKCACGHWRGEHTNQIFYDIGITAEGHGRCKHGCNCGDRGRFTWMPPIVAGAIDGKQKAEVIVKKPLMKKSVWVQMLEEDFIMMEDEGLIASEWKSSNKYLAARVSK